jgi:hypothetical protein
MKTTIDQYADILDVRDMNKMGREAYAAACGTLNGADLPNVYAILCALDGLRGYVKALDNYADTDPRMVKATAILNAYRPIV